MTHLLILQWFSSRQNHWTYFCFYKSISDSRYESDFILFFAQPWPLNCRQNFKTLRPIIACYWYLLWKCKVSLCSKPLQFRWVNSLSVSEVFPLLKHRLCTAGRKQIPEECVEIVTQPPRLVLTHRFQTQGLPLQKEGNVWRLPQWYSCNFHMAGMSSVLLGDWYQWSSAIQTTCDITHSLFVLRKKTLLNGAHSRLMFVENDGKRYNSFSKEALLFELTRLEQPNIIYIKELGELFPSFVCQWYMQHSILSMKKGAWNQVRANFV